jgi:hypothetical protein
MKIPNYVIATLLAASCVGYSSPSLSVVEAPRAFKAKCPPAYLKAPNLVFSVGRNARQAAVEVEEICEPKPHGKCCGENGLYSDGMGTCCSPIQTNPPSCQPAPRHCTW